MDDSKLTKNKSMNSEACRQSTANTLAEERLACVWISLPSRAVIVAAYGATVGAAVYVFGVVVVVGAVGMLQVWSPLKNGVWACC